MYAAVMIPDQCTHPQHEQTKTVFSRPRIPGTGYELHRVLGAVVDGILSTSVVLIRPPQMTASEYVCCAAARQSPTWSRHSIEFRCASI